MPELPEVERGRRLAQAVCVGRRVVGVRCEADAIVFQGESRAALERALLGKRVLGARRHGKWLWLDLDAAPHPLFHFGMSGAFHAPHAKALQLRSGPSVRAGEWPPRFMKIRIALDDGGELAMSDGRRLGRILLRADPRSEAPIASLGPDPYLELPSPARFAALLGRRHAAIKSTLMDQKVMAGIGNWVADEVLYQAGVDPRRPASSLTATELRRLRAKIKSVLARAVAVDADNERYPKSWLFHVRWGKRSHASTSDGGRIRHIRVGGRTTAWVPERQS